MLYNIVFSPTGGTQKTAEILSRALAKESVTVDLCASRLPAMTLTAGDVAVIAMPSYAGRVPCTASERIGRINGNNARAILVCVYGNRAYDDTLAEMKDLAEKNGFCPVAAVAAVAEHSMARKVGANRPDAEDTAVLQKMAAKIREKLENGGVPLEVPGTVPEKPMGNFGGKMAPKATKECTRCSICAEKCPAQAIDRDTMEADKAKCIGCMRCISVCPVGARKLNVVIESFGGVALSVLCSNPKENELFL